MVLILVEPVSKTQLSMFKFFIALFLSLILCGCGKKKPSPSALPAEQVKETAHAELRASLAAQPGTNALSSRCAECHQDIHHHWQKSHHGQANRLMSPELDDEAFSNEELKTIAEHWKFDKKADGYKLSVDGENHHVGMAIGLTPLIQYLVPAGGGRWQTPSTAWDPAKKEWFDVLGGDQRTSADWGHWSGRGMTWNTQCAWCHMTDYKKNYDVATDSYQSHWKEMGVGCTQCHGDIAATPDADNGCLIDLAKYQNTKKSKDLTVANCASCHSRRGQLDGDFHLGKKFGDHFQLQLPTQDNLYYADGQIKDEDYVWTSLRLSKMGHKGVNCMDCHNPHSTELKLPLANNTLCMSCHGSGTNGRIEGATLINPLSHTKHGPNSTGSSCVSCHMTHTTYMGRDDRRDHGFHVPDPLMTKELGIPNACNKCHTDKDTDWAIKSTESLFGARMNTPARQHQRTRTRAIGHAFSGQQQAIDGLLKAYENEENPAWIATLLQVMRAWSTDPRVQQIALEAVKHEDPLVRSSSCIILEFGMGTSAVLESMFKDPIKEVRVAAAWASRSRLSQHPDMLNELKESLTFSADQPTGAMSLAQLAIDSNKLDEAEKWLEKAVAHDQTSAASHETYAILLSRVGKPQKALDQLKIAAKLEPTNVRFTYLIALIYAEMGDTKSTETFLRDTIKKDPSHDRSHYNLGLLLASQEKLDEAVLSILHAEHANPASPDYPYARATLHMRQGDTNRAFEACRTALGVQRDYQPALNLIRQIAQSQRK